MEKVRGSCESTKTRGANDFRKSYTIIGHKSQQEMQSIVRVLQEQLDQITEYLTNCRFQRSGACSHQRHLESV